MSFWTSNSTHTCIPCRFSAKGTSICPYCQQPMTYMGKAFKPPRKSNDSQWRKVALMVDHDFRFGYCKCHRGSRRIKSLADAKALCKGRRSDKINRAHIDDVRSRQIAERRGWKAREYNG